MIDSPDEARKVVRTLKKYGAQVIKICATGGVFSRGDEPGAQQLTYGGDARPSPTRRTWPA
jgi:imidazolonepropionase-like amidohydrolase